MDDFVGRMTPVGWLGVQHVHGISKSSNDPGRDVASLDLEVAILWAIWHEKVRDTKRFLGKKDWKDPIDAGWKDLAAMLGELEAEVKAGKVSPEEEQAKRLEIRVLQLETLIGAAVEAGLTDVAAIPRDVYSKAG